METPLLIVGDGQGNIFEIPNVLMAGKILKQLTLPQSEDLIPVPGGSDLFELPGRIALGFDVDTGEFVRVKEYNGQRVFPVAAFMAPAIPSR